MVDNIANLKIKQFTVLYITFQLFYLIAALLQSPHQTRKIVKQ